MNKRFLYISLDFEIPMTVVLSRLCLNEPNVMSFHFPSREDTAGCVFTVLFLPSVGRASTAQPQRRGPPSLRVPRHAEQKGPGNRTPPGRPEYFIAVPGAPGTPGLTQAAALSSPLPFLQAEKRV